MDFKLKLRQEAATKMYSSAADAMFSVVANAKELPFQTCLTCISFEEDKDYCRHWRAKPPSRVIVYGCDNYFDINDVPF